MPQLLPQVDKIRQGESEGKRERGPCCR